MKVMVDNAVAFLMRTSIHLIHLHHIKIIMPLLQPRDPMMKSELDPLHELVQS
jgi:hypothetical protein